MISQPNQSILTLKGVEDSNDYKVGSGKFKKMDMLFYEAVTTARRIQIMIFLYFWLRLTILLVAAVQTRYNLFLLITLTINTVSTIFILIFRTRRMMDIFNFSKRNRYLLWLAERLGHSIISQKVACKDEFKNLSLCVSSFVYNSLQNKYTCKESVSKELRSFWKNQLIGQILKPRGSFIQFNEFGWQFGSGIIIVFGVLAQFIQTFGQIQWIMLIENCVIFCLSFSYFVIGSQSCWMMIKKKINSIIFTVPGPQIHLFDQISVKCTICGKSFQVGQLVNKSNCPVLHQVHKDCLKALFLSAPSKKCLICPNE